MSYSAYQSAPVTQQAVVSVNTGFDRHFCNYRKQLDDKVKHSDYISANDHVYTIQQRELVFRLNPRYDAMINRPKANGINDITLKVFSSVNNFPAANEIERFSNPNLKMHQANAILRSAISFVGVAVQPIFYENTNSKDTVAVQVSGSHTVWNSGDRQIRPGQLVVWDLPGSLKQQNAAKRKRMIPGEPMDKHLFATIPLECSFEDASGQKLYDFINYVEKVHEPHRVAEDVLRQAPIDYATPEGKALGTALGNGLNTEMYNKILLTMYEEIRSRIIGVALSGAQPGEQFDILLGSHH
jgi:hypothetical protein